MLLDLLKDFPFFTLLLRYFSLLSSYSKILLVSNFFGENSLIFSLTLSFINLPGKQETSDLKSLTNFAQKDLFTFLSFKFLSSKISSNGLFFPPGKNSI